MLTSTQAHISCSSTIYKPHACNAQYKYQIPYISSTPVSKKCSNPSIQPFTTASRICSSTPSKNPTGGSSGSNTFPSSRTSISRVAVHPLASKNLMSCTSTLSPGTSPRIRSTKSCTSPPSYSAANAAWYM